MGHNDHINFDLLDAIELLIDHDLLEEDSDLHRLALTVAEEGLLLPGEAAIYERDMIPILVKLDELRRDDDMRRLAEKDD
jgi:hypothetical protein